MRAPGCLVDARNAYGDTALMYACSEGDLELVKLLLEGGADPNLNAWSGAWEGLSTMAILEKHCSASSQTKEQVHKLLEVYRATTTTPSETDTGVHVSS